MTENLGDDATSASAPGCGPRSAHAEWDVTARPPRPGRVLEEQHAPG